ncbi:uncharacterized protein TRAVEDRAFT_43455 [Trametes versicolor FP-101664 SS1]|uniref:uncharacterized protein n=1 Tax=Trametes versicolor (strain FP-101664) TaxID=717944 RepID=UPI0004623B43|nr:uncharacterized protein TRAVEDRAFT_43455 [Trametes versicolor FP-101664 SS1]EIW63148.1 hypothetical protein TRAVEDRAFT_43455 [Trametes versicolor FP-101664 SS1]
MANSLPIEMWKDIFEFACTDGGRTASSLSHVSKAFRTVSATYRFRSVRLSRLRDIQLFLTHYEAALATASAAGCDPPRVCHLLLSFLPGETDVKLLDAGCHMHDFHAWRNMKGAWNARCVDLLSRLFALVGAHLKTLTVLQSLSIPLPFVRCTLPALRELTLLTDDRLFVRLPSEAEDHSSWIELSNTEFYAAGTPLDLTEVAANPPFPALERLHVVDVSGEAVACKRLPWATTLPVWAKLAPRLAVLHFSHADAAILRDVGDLLRTTPLLFSALRTLAVQPAMEGPEGAAAVDALREAYASVAPRHELSPIRVDCVDVDPTMDSSDGGYWPRMLAAEWSRRML